MSFLVLRSSLPVYFLLLILADYLSEAAYLPSPSTLIAPLSLNLTNSNPYHCTRSLDFVTPQFDAADCLEAIGSFADIEEKAHGHAQYEFLAPEAYQDRHSLTPQETPKRYVKGKFLKTQCKNHRKIVDERLIEDVGSCVLELVMMADPRLYSVCVFARLTREDIMISNLFVPQIDGRDVRPGTYAPTDVASYYQLWSQSERLADLCLRNFGIPGLITAGE